MANLTSWADVLHWVRGTLGEYAGDHNIDEIAHETFAYARGRFVPIVTTEHYWQIVEANILP